MKPYKRLFEKITYVDPNTLQIEVYSQKVVDNYIRKIKKNENLIPIFVDKKDHSHIVDGNHRAAAYKYFNKKAPIILVNRISTLDLLGKPGMTAEKAFEILNRS